MATMITMCDSCEIGNGQDNGGKSVEFQGYDLTSVEVSGRVYDVSNINLLMNCF
jgi:hypothetical protein